MKPAAFSYHAPDSVDTAVATLAQHADDAKVIAGGQSLVPILAMRMSAFGHLVDIGRIDSLTGIDRTAEGLSIGAMTTQATVQRSADVAAVAPLLARATAFIGHFQIRNRGTIGGSLAHADPAAEYPAVARTLGAELELTGPNGSRRVAADDFFLGTWMTAAEPDEILTAVHFPAWQGKTGFAVREFARRHGDFALAGVTCGVQVEGDTIGRLAIGLFGVGSTPERASAAEQAATGASVDDLDLDDLAATAVVDLDPAADLHAGAEHRKRIATALVREAVSAAVDEARQGSQREGANNV